jgi:UDP-glucose 4-epimerase
LKKRILLTGGNGFIGKNIRESFLGKKYEIIAPKSSEFNLIDTDCVDNFFRGKYFDVIVHSAVKPGHRNAQDHSNLFYSNLRMFENLERQKDKYTKFINLGSGAIYDTTKNISNVKEEQRFDSMGEKEHDFCKYVISKQIENLDNFVDLNIFGIFGKYEDWEIRFISNAICKAIFGLDITLRQNRRFSYLYVEDLMPILEFFIEDNVKYKSYNIVPDEKYTLLDIAQSARNLSKKNIEIKVASQGMGLEYTGDNTRLKNEVVNIKFTKLDESISALYNYYNMNLEKIDTNKLLQDK